MTLASVLHFALLQVLVLACVCMCGSPGVGNTANAGTDGGDTGHSFSLSERAEKLNDGREKLAEIEKNAKKNDCWKRAVARLRGDCENLDDESQGRLALDLTNCHLLQFGHVDYPCTGQVTLAECTKGMDEKAFGALSTFTAHTSNICFFLANQLWQERTQSTVNALASTSEHVVQQLNETAEQNSQLLQMQDSSLSNQKHLLHNTEILQDNLEEARREAEKMQQQTEEQWKQWTSSFGQLFENLHQIKSWMSSIGLSINMATKFLYYVVMATIAFFVTAAPQTKDSRAWLVAFLAIGFALEYVAMEIVLWWQYGPVDDLVSYAQASTPGGY